MSDNKVFFSPFNVGTITKEMRSKETSTTSVRSRQTLKDRRNSKLINPIPSSAAKGHRYDLERTESNLRIKTSSLHASKSKTKSRGLCSHTPLKGYPNGSDDTNSDTTSNPRQVLKIVIASLRRQLVRYIKKAESLIVKTTQLSNRIEAYNNITLFR